MQRWRFCTAFRHSKLHEKRCTLRVEIGTDLEERLDDSVYLSDGSIGSAETLLLYHLILMESKRLDEKQVINILLADG